MSEPKPPVEYELDHLQCYLDLMWDWLETELQLIKLLLYCTLLATLALALCLS